MWPVFCVSRVGGKAAPPRRNQMSSVAKNVSHAADQIRDAAWSARAGFGDFGLQAMKFLDTIRAQEARAFDSVLDQMGLQRRQSAVRPVLFFLAGAFVAGSVALMLAPTTGRKLRSQILDFLGVAKEREATAARGDSKGFGGSTVSGASGAGNGMDMPQAP
jgi:hypothetical protein